MCFVFVVVSVVFVARTVWFCGFPASTVGSIKADYFNVVHGIEV
jgi:hypothetical protein